MKVVAARAVRAQDPELRRSALARALVAAHGGRSIGLGVLARVVQSLEGGPMLSGTLRDMLARSGVQVGAFSYGACLDPGTFHPGVVVGRYVSMARYVRWGLDHPLDRAFLHPAFYQRRFGIVEHDDDPKGTLTIGHDAWISDMVVITMRCRRIGIGAVVGAGSVVTHDIPDFAVAYGAPARVVRRRFDDATCDALLRSRWWELPPAALRQWRHVAALSAESDEVRRALDEIAARRRPG